MSMCKKHLILHMETDAKGKQVSLSLLNYAINLFTVFIKNE